jgi:GDPmannose 4,6-dehydratase
VADAPAGGARRLCHRDREEPQRAEFRQAAFQFARLDWERHVRIDPRYYRPAEVDYLCGDASKALEHLGWQPTSDFIGLVHLMVDADMKLLDDELSGRTVKVDRP